MKCLKCDSESDSIYLKTDEKFEFLETESSNNNWDDWDFWAKIKCKECGDIFEFIQ